MEQKWSKNGANFQKNSTKPVKSVKKVKNRFFVSIFFNRVPDADFRVPDADFQPDFQPDAEPKPMPELKTETEPMPTFFQNRKPIHP